MSRPLLLALALAAGACSSSDGPSAPESGVLVPGRYAFSATIDPVAGRAARPIGGTLIVRTSTARVLGASWEPSAVIAAEQPGGSASPWREADVATGYEVRARLEQAPRGTVTLYVRQATGRISASGRAVFEDGTSAGVAGSLSAVAQ